MRKILLLIFVLLLSVLGLTACGQKTHEHVFDVRNTANEYLCSEADCNAKATYYYSCKCGEKGNETFMSGSPLGHSFTNYVSDNNATCVDDGTKTARCDRNGCNETDVKTDENTKLGHSFTNYVSDNNATCVKDGTKTARCDRNGCNETDVKTDENTKLGHSFTNYIPDGNATYERDGTKTARCDHDGCTETDVKTDENSMLKSSLAFKTLAVNGNKVYGKVSNKTKTFSFIEEIRTEGRMKFVVSSDSYGTQPIATKEIPLVIGDNKVYVIEMLDGEPGTVYEVTVRRKNVYTLTFNANGGTEVDEIVAEEDEIVSEPITTRAGYTFNGWNYDFSQKTAKSATITATWSADTDTPYLVEYYLEKAYYDDYDLYERVRLQGTTDTKVSAEKKTYDFFTLDSGKSVTDGNIDANGQLVLKLYYNRQRFTIKNMNPEYGTLAITPATIKYGCEIEIRALTHRGCDFVGWYIGNELMSSEPFIGKYMPEHNLQARFKIKDEMSIYEIEATTNTCKIKKLIASQLTQITIPEYVDSIGGHAFETSKLTSITIPDNIKSIGYYAFNCCYELKSVTIGKGIQKIENSVFSFCTSLTEVNMHDYIYTFEDYVFYKCSALTEITLPAYLKKMGGCTFEGCVKLQRITIPSKVYSIGYKSFCGCVSLTDINISEGVGEIEANAFEGCYSLTSITLPTTLTSIRTWAFHNCYRLFEVINNSNIDLDDDRYISTDIKKYAQVIQKGGSSGIVNVNGYLFYDLGYDCYLLGYVGNETELTLPTDYNGRSYKIRDYAFYCAGSIHKIIISGGVTEIGNYAFRNISTGIGGVDEIKYNGTVEEWNTIKKGSYYKDDKVVVVCSDGTAS